jgi:uncharacterized membrane protein
LKDLNGAIASVLSVGVVLSSLVIVAGLGLMVAAPPPGVPGSLQQVLASNFGTPTLTPATLVGGVARGDALSILELGTLILLATPLARVAASVVLFLNERDLLYVGVTLLVLGMLLAAIFVIGPMEA